MVLIGCFTVVSLMAWWWLHRYWFMAGDDYLHVEVGGDARGRFGAEDLWNSLVTDWTERNGRLADVAVRLVLRPGPEFYAWCAPVLMTLLGLSIGWAITRVRRAAHTVWPWAAGLLALPTVLWISPPLNGDAVLWASGALNYVLPTTLVIVGVGIFAHVAHGGRLSWAMTPFAVVAVVLGDALTETSALALLFVVITAGVTLRRAMPAQGWVVVAAEMVAFVVHMTAPGLWSRAGAVSDASDGPLVEKLVHGVALGAAVLWQRVPYLWLALLVAMVLLARTSGIGRSRQWLGWGAVAGVSAFMAVAAVHYTRRTVAIAATGLPPTEVRWQDWLLTGILTVMVVAVAATLWSARPHVGMAPLLLWVALWGSCAFNFGSGSIGARGFFPAIVLLLVLLLALAAGHSGPTTDTVVSSVVLAAMVVPTFVWFDQTRVQLIANERFVREHVVPLLEEAAASGRADGTITVPNVLPYPYVSYGAPFLVPRYASDLRHYYGIDEGVKLVNPRP